MKAIFVFLLAVALFILPFTSASHAKLGSRQGHAAIACTQNADCRAAAWSWTNCQNLVFGGITPATQSARKDCICSSDRAHWFPKVKSCIRCIENAQGIPVKSVLNPLRQIEADFCITGNLTYDDFVIQAHNIAANAGLPLELPQATFVAIQTGISTFPTKDQISVKAAAVTTAASIPNGCNYDNCLRQAIQSEDAVLLYCKTYTASVDAATTGHPRYVSMCNNLPMSISSACTCLVAAQTPNQTPSQSQTTSNVVSESQTPSNGGISTTKAKPSIHTVWTTTIIYITPGYNSTTAPGTPSTSCAETPSTSSTPVMKPSTSESSSSSHTSSSTNLKSATSTSASASSSASSKSSTTILTSPTSTTKSSSVNPSSTSSTSSSAASAAATWITLPASTEMKACAGSADCDTARNIYSSCLKDTVNGNQTLSWDCLCQTNIDEWKASVENCGRCVATALPVAPPGGYPSKILVPTLTQLMDVWCNQTSPSYKFSSVSSLDRAGLTLTSDLESPVVFFNMSLIDHPLPPNSPASSSSGVPLSSKTITTVATVTASTSKITSLSSNAPANSGSSTGIHTTLSTQTTSSAQATPSKWNTLPATDAMKQCQANDCQPAAKIYSSCMATELNGTNQDPVFDCFCTANKVQWKSDLSSCSNCIAAALPVKNNGTVLQSNVFNQQVELARQIFCNLTEVDMANHTFVILEAIGQVVTTSFQSPVNFFNMTLLAAPIPTWGAKRDAGLLPLEIRGGFRY